MLFDSVLQNFIGKVTQMISDTLDGSNRGLHIQKSTIVLYFKKISQI